MKDITNKEFDLIREFIKANYGISLADEKKSLVFSRLRSVLQQLNFDNFMDYYKFLIADKTGEHVITFIDKITTNHTYFMREVEHFDYFQNTVLPYIYEKEKSKDIRLWCAGCSSGEESYCLEMILHDYFDSTTKPGWNLEILATDISTTVLNKAVKGVYSNDHVEPLPAAWKKKYFKPFDNGSKIVVDDIKKDIIFRKFNLMEEKFPFKKKFQVIFCRNVMIYFNNETKSKLIERFYNVLEEGGYFFIGHSESLNFTETKFKYVIPALYRKT